MDPVCIRHPSFWPQPSVTACRANPDGFLRKTLLPTKAVKTHFFSLCVIYEWDTQQTVVFVNSQAKCLFWDGLQTCDRDFLKLKLMWCRALVFKVEVCAGTKRGIKASHTDCKAEIFSQIQIISQLLTPAGLIQHLLTALPIVRALVLQIRVGNMFRSDIVIIITALYLQFVNSCLFKAC